MASGGGLLTAPRIAWLMLAPLAVLVPEFVRGGALALLVGTAVWWLVPAWLIEGGALTRALRAVPLPQAGEGRDAGTRVSPLPQAGAGIAPLPSRERDDVSAANVRVRVLCASVCVAVAVWARSPIVVYLLSVFLFTSIVATIPRLRFLPLLLLLLPLSLLDSAIRERVTWLAQASLSDYVFPSALAALVLWRQPSRHPLVPLGALFLVLIWLLVAGAQHAQEPLPHLAATWAMVVVLAESRR